MIFFASVRHARAGFSISASPTASCISRAVSDDRLPVSEVARRVGLSSSRFQHLFAEEIGVPFRRYRSWHRLRAAIREVAKGSNFTTAAYAAGFLRSSAFLE